jgi:hypothetical protein
MDCVLSPIIEDIHLRTRAFVVLHLPISVNTTRKDVC